MAREENRISEIKAQPDECALVVGSAMLYGVWTGGSASIRIKRAGGGLAA